MGQTYGILLLCFGHVCSFLRLIFVGVDAFAGHALPQFVNLLLNVHCLKYTTAVSRLSGKLPLHVSERSGGLWLC